MYATTLGYNKLVSGRDNSKPDAEDGQNIEEADFLAVLTEWRHKDDDNDSQESINKSEDEVKDFAEESSAQDVVS
jgi:hypothetical protein